MRHVGQACARVRDVDDARLAQVPAPAVRRPTAAGYRRRRRPPCCRPPPRRNAGDPRGHDENDRPDRCGGGRGRRALPAIRPTRPAWRLPPGRDVPSRARSSARSPLGDHDRGRRFAGLVRAENGLDFGDVERIAEVQHALDPLAQPLAAAQARPRRARPADSCRPGARDGSRRLLIATLDRRGLVVGDVEVFLVPGGMRAPLAFRAFELGLFLGTARRRLAGELLRVVSGGEVVGGALVPARCLVVAFALHLAGRVPACVASSLPGAAPALGAVLSCSRLVMRAPLRNADSIDDVAHALDGRGQAFGLLLLRGAVALPVRVTVPSLVSTSIFMPLTFSSARTLT